MVTRISKLAVLVMLCTVGIGSSTRVLAQNRGDFGEWAVPLDWPLLAIHMILLKNGKVLCVYDGFHVNPNRFMVFDPVTKNTTVITTRPTVPGSDPPEIIPIFCAGHSQLPDGRVVLVGGGPLYEFSHNHTVIFDSDAPLSAPWSVVDDMPDVAPGVLGKRWYPTVTTLGDGTVLVVAGDDPYILPDDRTADIPLIFNSSNSENQQYSQLPAARLYLPYYPFNFQLSDSTLLYAGSDTNILEEHTGAVMFSKTLNISDETWTDLESVQHPIQGGSALMYGPDLIMKGGGYGVDGNGIIDGISEMYTLDMTCEGSSKWIGFQALNHARKEHYLVALPGGKILAVGGDYRPQPGAGLEAVLIPEIHNDPNDANLSWQDMAPMALLPGAISIEHVYTAA